MDFHLFIPITKVDVARRLVYGTIAEEVPDKSGEIMDYETARPEFEAWSAAIARASSGKSAGNLRAMHGSIAAGRLDRIVFDDEEKRIATVAKVVDDAEWNKVLEGVYTGFSMGGKYKKRWRDAARPELTRYTPEPIEVSLVDNPCIPSATFEVVKDDGSIELRKFVLRQAPVEHQAVLSKYGARHSKDDLAQLQAIHDTAVALGADCGHAPAAETEDDSDETGDGAAKLAGFDSTRFVREAMRKAIDEMAPKLDTFAKRLDALEAMPMPGGPLAATAVITKSQDAAGALAADPIAGFERHLDSLSPAQRAHALTKLALKNPLSR
ncbi:MAG TPA: hypothetical protein VII49_02835 [Rhizomicrobium sp.]